MLYIIIGYLICSILTFGIEFAYLEATEPLSLKNKQSSRQNMSFSIFSSLFGPIGLIMSFLFSGFAQYGLKFKP